MRIKASQLGRRITAELLQRVERSGLELVLVAQAKRRIDNSGDSEEKYPILWATTSGLPSYRAGGRPLRDTGVNIYQRLSGAKYIGFGQATFFLRGPQIAAWHQGTKGQPIAFRTEGPNFIPLTRRAVRLHRPGMDPKAEGLRPGVDYIMAWRGVEVKRRPIYNMPPEDRDEITQATAAAIQG